MVSIPEKSAFPLAKAARGQETVTLRGTSRGFELIIADGVDLEAILGSIRGQLDKSPAFFAGNDVTVQFAGHPIVGSLGPLEEIAEEYELTIVAVRSELEVRRETARAALAAVSDLLEPAETTDSVEVDFSDADEPETAEPEVAIEPELVFEPQVAIENIDAPTPPASTVSLEAFDAVRTLALQAPDAAKIIIGPVRSGCILEATEHIVIVGDVNPGAEVTSIGAIIVLGRMRGIAHAGAGGNPAFIFALSLEPQQLRLGTKVARAGDGELAGTRPEIARIEKDQIIVEPYAGKLPFSLASVLF